MTADLGGRVAIVTGAAGRLGHVWSAALAGAGARVAGVDTAAAWLRSSNNDDTAGLVRITADVTDRASLDDALRRTVDSLGSPSVLVNNAGIDQPPDHDATSWLFENIPDEVSAAVMDVNALGVLRTCQAFGGHIALTGGGSIINIGSVYGSRAPDPGLYAHLRVDPPFLKPPSYTMSKAAAAGLTRYLAALWGPSGVRVNTLSPGGVYADQDPTFRVGYERRVPLGRMAEPEDLTGPLLFLASDQSRYVTGQELMVDGGLSCW